MKKTEREKFWKAARTVITDFLILTALTLPGAKAANAKVIGHPYSESGSGTATPTKTVAPTETPVATRTAVATATATSQAVLLPPEWRSPKTIVECCSSSGEKLAALLQDEEKHERINKKTGINVLSTGIGGLNYGGVAQNLERVLPPGFVPPGSVVVLDGPGKNAEIQGLSAKESFEQLRDLVPKMRAHLDAQKNNILIMVNEVRPSNMPGLDLTAADDEFNAYLAEHFPELGEGVWLGRVHQCFEFPNTGRTDPRFFDPDGLHLHGEDNYVRLVRIDEDALRGNACPAADQPLP